MSPTPALHTISNAEFLRAIYGDLADGERYWATEFVSNPKTAGGKGWSGRAVKIVADSPLANAYVSTAVLKPVDGKIHKKRECFSRLTVVVVDDLFLDKCSYALETSEGNHQVGFVLSEPICDEAIAGRLQTALGQQKLYEADKSGYSSVRYVRLPVASNTKSDPPWQCRLTKWQPEVKFTLEDLAGLFNLPFDYILSGGAGAAPSAAPIPDTGGSVDDIEADPERVPLEVLFSDILTGTSFHTPIACIAARFTGWGIPESGINAAIKGTMLAAPRRDGWAERFADIPRAVGTAIEKYGPKARGWPSLVDPFAEYVVPPFPMDTLPDAYSRLCMEHAAGSGFDPGAYAFALLVTTASLIDHRARLQAGILRVPAYLWGGLAGGSGAGKSPVMSAAMTGVRILAAELLQHSRLARQQWLSTKEQVGRSKGGPQLPPKTPWREIVVMDTTVEALAELLQDNPEGLLVHHEEITEFIGRMDAYSSNGSGKDRDKATSFL